MEYISKKRHAWYKHSLCKVFLGGLGAIEARTALVFWHEGINGTAGLGHTILGFLVYTASMIKAVRFNLVFPPSHG